MNGDYRYYTATALLCTGSRWSRRTLKTIELGFTTAATREDAVDLAFASFPNANEVRSGYGYLGGSDIMWHKREDNT
jgi:hypothetical protein